MSDNGILSPFFAGLKNFDGLAWEVRVTFPFPDDPADLPNRAAYLEAHLRILARATRARLLERIGPTTWVLRVSTEYVHRSFVGLDQFFRNVLGHTPETIDITPLTTIPRHEPQLVGRLS